MLCALFSSTSSRSCDQFIWRPSSFIDADLHWSSLAANAANAANARFQSNQMPLKENHSAGVALHFGNPSHPTFIKLTSSWRLFMSQIDVPLIKPPFGRDFPWFNLHFRPLIPPKNFPTYPLGPRTASGQNLAHASTTPLAMSALMLNKSSRVMPGFRGIWDFGTFRQRKRRTMQGCTWNYRNELGMGIPTRRNTKQ